MRMVFSAIFNNISAISYIVNQNEQYLWISQILVQYIVLQVVVLFRYVGSWESRSTMYYLQILMTNSTSIV
jgi:hypothetical protein